MSQIFWLVTNEKILNDSNQLFNQSTSKLGISSHNSYVKPFML